MHVGNLLSEPVLKALRNTLQACLLLGCASAGAAAPGTVAPGTAASCEPRDLGFNQKEAGWHHVPLSMFKRDTVYTLVQDGDRRSVLRATADRSASLYMAMLKPANRRPGTLSWEWRTEALVPGADNRDKGREDAPLRVIVAFDGDLATLPAAEQARFAIAKGLTGSEPPFAVLMYIWTDHVSPGSVISSAHTSQVKMFAVASGQSGIGSWQAVQRDLVQDYTQAYGTAPGPVLSVAVMTDTDNTGSRAVGEYAGIRLSCDRR